jgi:aspergillopepsin I
MFLPVHIVREFYQQVDGAEDSSEFGGWIVACSTPLPSFTAIISGYRAVVGGDLIKLGPLSPTSTYCLGGIQNNMNNNVSIFGDVFLRSQYVVFDARGPSLGFAPQR